MKKIIATTLALGLMAWSGSAMAGIIDFNFMDTPTNRTADTADFLGSDSLTWLTASANPSNTRDLYWNSFRGLGVDGRHDSSQVDGNGPNESIEFTFAEDVQLLSVGFSWVARNDDFSFTVNNTVVSNKIDIPGGDHLYTFSGIYIADLFGIGAVHSNDDFYITSLSVDDRREPVPEPATMLLMGLGLAGLVGYNRKRSSKFDQ